MAQQKIALKMLLSRIVAAITILLCNLASTAAFSLHREVFRPCGVAGTKIQTGVSSKLYGVVNTKWLDSYRDRDRESDDDFIQTSADEPTWNEMFPRSDGENYTPLPAFDREYPDYPSLEPDDPLFLDMPWPTKVGPESSAFAKHMQWKRALTDGERKRWQQWAVYERLSRNHKYGYAVEDYVMQNMIRDVFVKADAYKQKNQNLESAMYNAIGTGYNNEEVAEVGAVVDAFYSAFNRKNFDEIRVLWLPSSDETSCILPGYDRVVGTNSIQKLYKKAINGIKPFGSVRAEVVSVYTMGFIAIVHVIENVEKGSALKIDIKKKSPSAAKDKDEPVVVAGKKVHSLMVLRKFNKQWRISQHHAIPFKSSDFTPVKPPPQKANAASTIAGSFGIPEAKAAQLGKTLKVSMIYI